MAINKLKIKPVMVSAAAIYPYAEDLHEMGARESRFGEPYNLFRVVGTGKAQRIWVPRNMAPSGVPTEFAEGMDCQFKSLFVPRNDEQTRVISETVQLLAQGENFITEAPTGFGKSLIAGTLVIMGDGTLKTVENVKNGDVLMGPDSKPRTVSGTLKHWSPIYRITPTKGEPFECNDVHILPLKCTSDMKQSTKYRKGEITCIEVKDYIKQSKTFKHMMKLWRAPGIDLPERKVFDPYIVGLYLADGTKSPKDTPTLCCGDVKQPALDYVESVVTVSSRDYRNGAWTYLIPSLKPVQELSVVDGRRHIHDRYLRNSRENRMQLLAGLLDGDGHLAKNTVFELACKDESFKDEVLFLCRSLGFAAYAKLSTKGIKSTGFTGQYWVITISGNTDQIPTKIPSKQAKPRGQKKDHLVTGFTVEYVRDDWVYGFQLDGDHLYLLKDFTVSHNTACTMDIIAKVGKKTLVVVTKEDIRDQWVDAAKKFLGLTDKDIGFIQADKFQVPGKKLVIAMIQSLAKEDRYPAHAMKEFGLAIWDESGSPDTLVTTSKGQVRIQDLVRSKTQCKALSFNTDTGGYEWREIRAYHEHPPKNPMMRITHESGYLDFTSEHLLYTDRGWVKAKDLLVTDFLTLDTEHSVLYNNSKQLETKDGSMATRDSSWRYLSPNWGYQDKSQIESSAWGSSNTTGHGEVSTARALRPHTPQRGGESRLGRALLLLCNVATGLVDSLLPRHLYTGWSQNPSAITCKSTLARVAGLVGNGRWVKSGWVHSNVSKQVSGVRRGESSNTSFSVRYEKFIEKSQGVLSRILKRVEQTTKAGVSPVLHTLNDVQVRWCAFWRKSSSVQGVWLRHSHEGRGAAQTGILSEGNLPKGKEVHELPTETYSSFGGSKTKSNKMGGKVRVLSVEEIATPGLVYDIEVEGNHNFVANGVVVHNCHRVAADYFSQSCYRVPAKLRLGLSATPDRKDGKEEALHSHIGLVQVKTEAAPMTPRVIARRSPWTIPMTRVKQKNGTVKVGPLPHSPGKCGHVINMLANHHARNDMIARFVSAAFKKGRNILVQSDRKEHLETLAMMIQKQGVPPAEIGYYLGGMTAAQRDYAKGKSVIMATYAMTAEATDIPWLDTLVMATPKSDVRQIVGRILRQYEGKQEPVVFDLIDSSSNVFQGYWNKRSAWYKSIGAEVGTVPSGTSQT